MYMAIYPDIKPLFLFCWYKIPTDIFTALCHWCFLGDTRGKHRNFHVFPRSTPRRIVGIWASAKEMRPQEGLVAELPPAGGHFMVLVKRLGRHFFEIFSLQLWWFSWFQRCSKYGKKSATKPWFLAVSLDLFIVLTVGGWDYCHWYD